MNDDLMTAGEAATYVGISRQRLDLLAQEGRVPRRRVGRFWLYSRADLDNLPERKDGRPKEEAETPARAVPA